MSTTTSSHFAASPTAAAGTSAPVLEYLCLFTHDLRRKQKRWQDGRLKYHTFNRRIMAYDDRGNFIGDMHWRSDWDFDAGEEIQLERGAVIVQVSDCIGQQSQDLSELVDKRVQEKEQRARQKEQRGANMPSLPTPRRAPELRPDQPASGTHPIRHRPLTALIGTPTGHHGRAVVPSDSPFEQRRRIDDTAVNEDAQRPTKRRRHEDTPPSKLGYAQSLFGTALTLSGAPSSSARLPSQPMPSQTLQRSAPLRVSPLPSPEAEDRNIPASTSSDDCRNAAGRVPLRPIDDQRTNVDSNATNRRSAKGARIRNSLPPRTEKASTASTPKQRPRPASPPEETTDSTLSGDDFPMGAPRVTEQSPVAPPHSPGSRSTSRHLLDRSTIRKRPSVQAKPMRPPLDSSIEVDMLPVQQEPKALDNNPLRTELRLKPRKKRGLLVVSEQASAKPTEEIVEELLPTAIPPSVSGNYHRKAAKRKVDEPLRPSTTPRSGAEAPGRSISHPDSSLALKSGRCRGDGHDMYEAGDGVDDVDKMQNEEQQVDLGCNADVSARKSKKKRNRGKTVSVAHPVDDPVGEPQSAAKEQGDANTNEHGTIEARTALPPAPRLVKLSRKSVRSKELIGFVFDDIDARGGNGSFSINFPDQSRTKDPDSHATPPAPIQAGVYDPRTAIGKDRQPVDFSDDGVTDAALNDNACFTLPLGADSVQSAPGRNQSPLQQLSPVRVERLEPCAQGMIKDKGIDVAPPAEKGDREAYQPAPDDISTVPPTLPKEKQVTRGPPLGQCGGQEAGVKTIATEDDFQLGLAPQGPPKLVNPATRGRKAALKSHAAGQVPQPILPADIGVQVGQIPQREQPKTTGAGCTASGINKALPKIKMTFPGFVSAKGGGPWSREAHDLLETGRPS
ncbi:hypothetical protein CONLIGDRAFT_287825 [Coniochaeta ligniaria NRRL 30616]|uniref:5'-3' DNA helicase ZGRF1-like N-terminal domain-containing protein n=1 Tax=Coniochaeta ligniaria NRRL 30616 TaxID=1408157 RepID=A0A1J7ITN5_9PEZI|nr:hypothetical protein CONLIGDRAFT_287825 [Coniochaeta ligniaria NRRL 30616]